MIAEGQTHNGTGNTVEVGSVQAYQPTQHLSTFQKSRLSALFKTSSDKQKNKYSNYNNIVAPSIV